MSTPVRTHGNEATSWQLDIEQAAALVSFRCKLIAYENDIDEAKLKLGEPCACIPILRYVFSNFSEPLFEYFESSGHQFPSGSTDRQLVSSILRVWNLLSPDRLLPATVTAAKLLKPGCFGLDRLLFTLQCILICCKKHCELVAQVGEAWLQSGIDWTHTSPRQQFGIDPIIHDGTESQRVRSTVAWMAAAYREQMSTISDEAKCHGPIDGAGEQEAWLNKVRGVQCSDDAQMHVSESSAGGEIFTDSSTRSERSECCGYDGSQKLSGDSERTKKCASISESCLGADLKDSNDSNAAGLSREQDVDGLPIPRCSDALLSSKYERIYTEQMQNALDLHCGTPRVTNCSPNARRHGAHVALIYQRALSALHFGHADTTDSLGSDRQIFDEHIFDMPFTED